MARQREQWELEFRVGPGETDGRRGMRAHRQNVDPQVAEWFRDVVADPAFPIDPRVGAFHVYINGAIASSITAGELPPAPASPTDLARVEQLRSDAARLEARVTTFSAQAAVEEHRLRSIQAEIVASEARVVAERERVAATIKLCDEEIERARKGAAEEKQRILEDLRSFREAMLVARTDTAGLFENLRTAEHEESRHIAKRRIKAQEQLTAVYEECAELEEKALKAAIAGGNRPTMAEQASKMVDNVANAVVKVIDRVMDGGAGEG